MRYFCTLFDSNYLSRGLAMYESLRKHSSNFRLFVLAFDEETEKILRILNLEEITVISLMDFEDDELKSIKQTRTRVEYFWTCTPSLVKYCIEKYNLDMCTYLDADIYFYANPEPLFEEMGEASIMISPHRYTPIYDQSSTSGIYCVQFVTFRNDRIGIMALEWWRQSCNTWCYARVENGKLGDQKYLDDWPERFEGVHVMKHLGGGVAPWNVQQYKFIEKGDKFIYCISKKGSELFQIIFYHFHRVKFMKNNKISLGPYIIPKWAIENLYRPYISHLFKIERKLEKIGNKSFRIVIEKRSVKEQILCLISKLNIFKREFFVFLNFIAPILNKISKKIFKKEITRLLKLLVYQCNIYSENYFKRNSWHI